MERQEFLKQLNDFLGIAALATYAGDGAEVSAQRPGFTELEFTEGDFYYRDSYAGHFCSAGQEVVWYKEKPVWTQSYGGGMKPGLREDHSFSHQTFSFLKKALSEGEKIQEFQPRGPKTFTEGNWEYSCRWEGSLEEFKGHEEIQFQGKVVFTHDFFGGLLVHK